VLAPLGRRTAHLRCAPLHPLSQRGVYSTFLAFFIFAANKENWLFTDFWKTFISALF
jgi:hypothetical protein